MKHLKPIITILVFTITFNFAQTQEKIELENSVLWKVEHPDLEKPSYIYGTLHLMCEEDFRIPAKITRTLNSVDALVLEINLTDPEEIKAMQESMISPKLISEELSESQFLELDHLVLDVLGAPLSNFDSYGLSILNFLLISKMLPCTKIKSLETELSLIASEKEVPILALETVSDQLEAARNAFPADFTFSQMMLFESYKKDFNDAIVLYNKEDISNAVNLITKEIYMDENATAYMQIKRNENWIGKMEVMMNEGSKMFAVGAAHLTEDFGLIHLLRLEGYTLTAVLN